MLTHPRQMPILQQFSLVQVAPFKNEPRGSGRELAVDFSRFDLDRNFVFAVRGMEVRWLMLAPEHPDHNSKKS